VKVPLTLLAAAALAISWPAAGATREADAGALDPARVAAAWHEPAVVPPHTQWHGYLRLQPGTAVEAASYQVCRVGQSCFAPPAPARRLDPLTFAFDTATYTVYDPATGQGVPVDYQAGWRIGVKWILSERTANGTRTVEFPSGPSATDPACAGDAMALACQERHYIAFDMPPAARATPGPALAPLLAGLLLAAGRRHA
jgi:hypothetical protein